MENLYPYLLLILGILSGYALGVYANKKIKAKAEQRVTELELNMLDDQSEISRLKTLVTKLLEMDLPLTTGAETNRRREKAI